MYEPGTVPEKYRCGKCGVTNVKLWRLYNSIPVELLCAKCVQKAEGKQIDPQQTDNIGGHVAAIPCEEGCGAYWGYTSVPPDACNWWYNLPMEPTNEEVPDMR